MRRACLLASIAAAGLFTPLSRADCTLLSPADLEPVMGAATLEGGPMPHEGELCMGRSGEGMISVRRYTRPGKPGRVPEPVSCDVKEASGRFNTSCTAAKPPRYAVIEVAGTRKVPVEKVRLLAEKVLGRL